MAGIQRIGVADGGMVTQGHQYGFQTVLGEMDVVIGSRGVLSLQWGGGMPLPLDGVAVIRPKAVSILHRDIIRQIVSVARSRGVGSLAVPLMNGALSPADKAIMSVGWAQRTSVGSLSEKSGVPKSELELALRQNRFAFLVPCHRVVDVALPYGQGFAEEVRFLEQKYPERHLSTQ